MIRSPRLSRGVALVLVLMVVGTLSVLMLQISLTARHHVKQSQGVSDRIEAEFSIQSREASLAFALLTQPWGEPSGASEGGISQTWRFDGRVFNLDDAAFQIQDLAGLRPLPQSIDSAQSFGEVLQRLLNMPPEEAAAAAAKLNAEMRAPDWTLLQSFSDLTALGILSPSQVDGLRQFVTLYPNLVFNPLTAPAPVLGLQLEGSTLAAVLALRDRGELDPSSFAKVTGVEDEFNSFSPGSALRIRTQFQKGRVAATREGIWIVRPYDREPLRHWSRHRVRSAE